MRENRLYGSEGGEAKSLPYPYHLSTRYSLGAFATLVMSSLLPQTWPPADQARRKEKASGSGTLDCFASLALTGEPLLPLAGEGGARGRMRIVPAPGPPPPPPKAGEGEARDDRALALARRHR